MIMADPGGLALDGVTSHALYCNGTHIHQKLLTMAIVNVMA